jgi:FtsH-binding integral membrane protein
METTLFMKVMLLLTAAMLCGGVGAWLGRGLKGIGSAIVLFVLAIVGIFVTMGVAHVSAGGGVFCLAIWTGIVGAMVGPALDHYTESLGWHTVCGAFVGTGGTMAICGIVGAMSGINFGFLGGILGIALIGLIIFGIVGMFVRMSREVSMGQAVIGMVVFAGYFLFDFWRMSKAENTWERAIELTMNLYLDFINFLLYLLQFLEKSKEHDTSMITTPLHNTAMAMLQFGGDHALTLASNAHHMVSPVLAAVGLC